LGRVDVDRAVRHGSVAEGLPDVVDELPCAAGEGVRERGGVAAILDPPDFVGGMGPLRQARRDVRRGGGSPRTVAGLEDHQGEFLARPVGAVALPVEDRGELPGGTDVAGTLDVTLPQGLVNLGENVLHLEDSFESAARFRFVKRLPTRGF